jgi:hypothetical protein
VEERWSWLPDRRSFSEQAHGLTLDPVVPVAQGLTGAMAGRLRVLTAQPTVAMIVWGYARVSDVKVIEATVMGWRWRSRGVLGGGGGVCPAAWGVPLQDAWCGLG